MCGFLVTPKSIDQTLSQNAFESFISYRGTLINKYFDHPEFNLYFTRLPITDHNAGANQPYIWDENILVFNGQIYNHHEIRSILRNRYHITFDSDCDTETFIKAFILLGPVEFFSIACGMWAYVLIDSNHNLHWGRDEFSVKPLFVANFSGFPILSSSIPALNQLIDSTIDIQSFQRFITTGYQNPNDSVFFSDICSVQPGTYTFLNTKSLSCYTKSIKYLPNRLNSPESRLYFEDVFSSYIPDSNNNISLALSGGLDSSIIAHLLHKFGCSFSSFSLDLPSSIRENSLIDKTVSYYNLQHEYISPSADLLLPELKRIIQFCGQPLRSAQPLFQHFLRKAAQSQNCSVFFSGDGADEVFGGYTQGFFYHILDIIPYSSLSDINNIFSQFSSFLGNTFCFSSLHECILFIHQRIDLNRQPDFWADIFADFISPLYANNLFDYQQKRLYDCPMTYWLFAEDCISLLNNIETRVPFLDHRICSLSHSINTDNLYFNGVNKFPLRSLFLDLPDHLIKAPSKYPRPADTLNLIYSHSSSEYIHDFLFSDFFISAFSSEISLKLSEQYSSHADRKLSSYADCWFRILTSAIFVDTQNV